MCPSMQEKSVIAINIWFIWNTHMDRPHATLDYYWPLGLISWDEQMQLNCGYHIILNKHGTESHCINSFSPINGKTMPATINSKCYFHDDILILKVH